MQAALEIRRYTAEKQMMEERGGGGGGKEGWKRKRGMEGWLDNEDPDERKRRPLNRDLSKMN